jgi:hypothetical protein
MKNLVKAIEYVKENFLGTVQTEKDTDDAGQQRGTWN